MRTPGYPAQDLNWLVTNFVERVPYVAHAAVVSSDGIPLAVSDGFPPDRAERLATVACGLSSLVQGAARAFDGGTVVQTVVELDFGVLVVMTISHGASLAVLAAPDGKMGVIAYEMTRLVERAGRLITPSTRVTQRAGAAGSDR
jgi:predicted regulator of Ras-like GTPase activity (Roadblock/LC7/MglB family)